MIKIGDPRENVEKVSTFRRILPQVIASTIKNLHVVDLGLIGAFPTIIIPALTGIPNEHNRNELLSITAGQASWVVSIAFISQTVGSLISGMMTDPLGRKRSMILVNIPFAIGWLVLFQTSAVWQIFVGFAILGLGIGLMESAVITFIGEICQPSLRGIMIAYSNICAGAGIFTVYILNAWLPWRMVALCCLTVPIISTISLCFVPETPHWLLSKNRTKQAQKSLCWLRGWTTKEAIAHEFRELQRHSDRSKSCNSCIKQELHCIHPPPTLGEKFAELKRKRTLKPFFIIISLFFLVQFTGAYSMRSFVVQIFKAYDSPIASDRNVMILGLVENIANVSFMCLVRFTGRRRIFITMISGICLSSFFVSCYGFINLPSGYVSFNLKNQTFHLENPNYAYFPTICIYFWTFCSFCGFMGMPWMLLSELFSFKSRGIASGIAAALNYALGFISKKTYYNLETLLSLPGISLMYCLISAFGLILTYFILPETENRTLEDIELHFSDNSKRFTDRKIAKSSTDRSDLAELLTKQGRLDGAADAIRSNKTTNKHTTERISMKNER